MSHQPAPGSLRTFAVKCFQNRNRFKDGSSTCSNHMNQAGIPIYFMYHSEFITGQCKAWFPFGRFLPFVARFGFLYQQKATMSNAMLEWKHPQKTKTSNKKP